MPTIADLLNAQEWMNAPPTEEIYRKAFEHAQARGAQAKDPFATMFDMRTPAPK